MILTVMFKDVENKNTSRLIKEQSARLLSIFLRCYTLAFTDLGLSACSLQPWSVLLFHSALGIHSAGRHLEPPSWSSHSVGSLRALDHRYTYSPTHPPPPCIVRSFGQVTVPAGDVGTHHLCHWLMVLSQKNSFTSDWRHLGMTGVFLWRIPLFLETQQ